MMKEAQVIYQEPLMWDMCNKYIVDDLCTSFFDQAILKHMVAIDENSKGKLLLILDSDDICYTALDVLRKNFNKVCQCLPENYKTTLSRVRRVAAVPDGLESMLADLPTSELANCHILSGMIRPLRKEIHLVGFCDSVKELVEGDACKTFMENLKRG